MLLNFFALAFLFKKCTGEINSAKPHGDSDCSPMEAEGMQSAHGQVADAGIALPPSHF